MMPLTMDMALDGGVITRSVDIAAFFDTQSDVETKD